MNKAAKKETYSIILGLLFKMAWPVWKIHQGRVPPAALEELERHGDWPRGLAAVIMRRISRDKRLKRQLEKWCQ